MVARYIPLLLLATGGTAFAQAGIGTAPVGPIKAPDRPIGPGDVFKGKITPPGETITVTLTTTGPGKLAINKLACVPKSGGATRTCTRTVPKGAEVRITPMPDSGALFVKWIGFCDFGHPTSACTLNPTSDFATGAAFSLPEAKPKLTLKYNVAVSTPTSAPDRIVWTFDPPMPVACSQTVAQAVGKKWYWVDVTCTAFPAAGTQLKVSGNWQTAAGNPSYPVMNWNDDCHDLTGPHKVCTLDMTLSRTAGTYGISPDQK